MLALNYVTLAFREWVDADVKAKDVLQILTVLLKLDNWTGIF